MVGAEDAADTGAVEDTTMAITRQVWEHPTPAVVPTVLRLIRQRQVAGAIQAEAEGITELQAEVATTTMAVVVEADTMLEVILLAAWAGRQRTTPSLRLPQGRHMPRHRTHMAADLTVRRALGLDMDIRHHSEVQDHTPHRQTLSTRMAATSLLSILMALRPCRTEAREVVMDLEVVEALPAIVGETTADMVTVVAAGRLEQL